ncbi:MAG: hypothetical protein LC793_16800 [Thermomicrobia bacterium]|nr:hypothetical protein [Thermomicrobia bacterium]MCA1722772.1 hypothetical protein [Thermomicrobia bacterium]
MGMERREDRLAIYREAQRLLQSALAADASGSAAVRITLMHLRVRTRLEREEWGLLATALIAAVHSRADSEYRLNWENTRRKRR